MALSTHQTGGSHGPACHRVVWVGRDTLQYLITPLQWEETSLIRSACSVLCPTWSWLLSGMGESTTSLGNLSQRFTHPHHKKFLIANLNLPSLSLKPFPLFLSQQALLKNLSLCVGVKYQKLERKRQWSDSLLLCHSLLSQFRPRYLLYF